MPVAKIFVASSLLLPVTASRKEALGARVAAACIQVLRARADLVQCMLVSVADVLAGPPVYIDVDFRDQPFRDAPTLEAFMAELARAAEDCFGVAPRIRCFAQAASTLHARN